MTDRMAAMGETELIARLRTYSTVDDRGHHDMNSHPGILDEAADALEHAAAREAKMRGALVKLDALLDFGEPIEAGECAVFDDPTAINEAFEQARASLGGK